MNYKTFLLKTLWAALVALMVFSPLPGVQAEEGRLIIIEIRDFEFIVDENVTLRPGDTVVWINRDFAPHTATAMDKSWDSGQLKKDESWQMVITSETLLDYFCRYHPAMKSILPLKE
ncbi:MAG: hypothetical protein V3R64_01980 [Sphingomonadales bacterium]